MLKLQLFASCKIRLLAVYKVSERGVPEWSGADHRRVVWAEAMSLVLSMKWMTAVD